MNVWAQSTTSLPQFTMYETVKLADGIYAFISPESNGAMVTGNTTLVIGDDSALVVDSGHFPSLTMRMLAEIQKLAAGKPVRYLVNTHWHPDHTSGNGVYLKTFPGIQIVSTDFTRAAIRDVLPKKEVDLKTIDRFEQTWKNGVNSRGETLNAEQRKYFDKVGPEMVAFRPERQAAIHVLPTTTFKTEMSVYLGRREVRLIFLGRGNTQGDAVVYLPDAKILATGDLIVYPVPYPFGSFIGEWIDTLNKLQAIDAAILVPGHGPIMPDKQYLKQTVAILEATLRYARDAVARNLSFEEANKQFLSDPQIAELRSKFVAASSDRGQVFDLGFAPEAFRRAMREAKQGPLPNED